MSHLPHHIKHLDSYDRKNTVYSSDCLNEFDRYLENQAFEADRVRLSRRVDRELHNAVAKLHNQGFNGGVERLLAVLAGEKALELTSRGQEVKEMLEGNNLTSDKRSQGTREMYYLEYVALYEEAERGLAGVPPDQKAEIILSFQYMVAVTYRKTIHYHCALLRRRKPAELKRDEMQRYWKRKRIGLSEATEARYSHLYSREHRDQKDYITILRRLLEEEDDALVRTNKGRHQIRRSIGGYTVFQMLREVEAIIWGLIHFNLLENSSPIESNSDSLQIPRRPSSKKSIVWIIFIRISPDTDTDNDGVQQLVAIIAVALFLNRNGFDIEIYEKRYFRSDASRHDPLTDPGLGQIYQTLSSDPYLVGREVRVVTTEPLRFGLHPRDIESIDQEVQRCHPRAMLTSCRTLFQHMGPYQMIDAAHYDACQIVSRNIASRCNVTKSLDQLMENNDEQEEVFSLAESIRQSLGERELKLISECLADSNEILRIEVARLCKLWKKHLKMLKRGMSLPEVLRSFIEEFESMEWTALSNEQKKIAVYLRTSSVLSTFNSSFQRLMPESESVMGEDASLLPVRQLCRIASAIQTITGENPLETGNFQVYFDCCVPRVVSTKQKLMECLLYCLKLKGSGSLVVVPRLDRIGSDKDVVDLAMGIFEMCRPLLVAEQMNYSLGHVRDAESSRKKILAGLLKDRNSKRHNYRNRIEDPRLRELQETADQIIGTNYRRDDLDGVIKILTTDSSERFPLPKAALDILEPIPIVDDSTVVSSETVQEDTVDQSRVLEDTVNQSHVLMDPVVREQTVVSPKTVQEDTVDQSRVLEYTVNQSHVLMDPVVREQTVVSPETVQEETGEMAPVHEDGCFCSECMFGAATEIYVCPNILVGPLIGRGGRNVKKLEEKTGCNIRVDDKPVKDDDTKDEFAVFRITRASKEKRIQAKEALRDVARSINIAELKLDLEYLARMKKGEYNRAQEPHKSYDDYSCGSPSRSSWSSPARSRSGPQDVPEQAAAAPIGNLNYDDKVMRRHERYYGSKSPWNE